MTPNDMYFRKTKQLHYWVQHVLPLVYDDSLSFYELLSKVVEKINILVENNNKLPDYIEETIKEQIQDIENLEEIIKEVIKELLEMDYYTKAEIDLLLLELKNTINEEFDEYYTKGETDQKYLTSSLRYLERDGEKVNRTLHVVEPHRRHIDAINGNDDNDGLTAETAFQTLDRFFDECNLHRADIRAFIHNPTNGTLIYSFTKRVFTGVCLHLSAYSILVDEGTPNEHRVYDENIVIQPDNSADFDTIIGYNCRFNLDHLKFECGLASDNGFVTLNNIEFTLPLKVLGSHITLNNCTFDRLELRYSIGNTDNITFKNVNHYDGNGKMLPAFDVHQGSYITNENDLIVDTVNDEAYLIRVDESTFVDRSNLTNRTSHEKLDLYVMQSLWRSSAARYTRFNIRECTESSIDIPSELAVDVNGTVSFNDIYVNGTVRNNGRSVLFTIYSPRSLVNGTRLTATAVNASIKVLKNVPTQYTIGGETITVPVTSTGFVGDTSGVVDWIALGGTINAVKKDNHYFDMEIALPTDANIVRDSVPVIFFDALTIQIS